jgi:extradiol dioxygenase family protein
LIEVCTRIYLARGDTDALQRNAVDGHGVPVRHFGMVLPMTD